MKTCTYCGAERKGCQLKDGVITDIYECGTIVIIGNNLKHIRSTECKQYTNDEWLGDTANGFSCPYCRTPAKITSEGLEAKHDDWCKFSPMN